MWHRRRRRRLSVKPAHRKALLRNLVQGLALHRRIFTTFARAKETARFAEQMVTLAKEGTLAARRQLIRRLNSPETARIFMEEIAPRFADRRGGYTRVLRTGKNRHGDGATAALVEFSVPIEITPKPKKKKKTPKKEKEEKPAKKAAPGAEERKKEERKKPEKEAGKEKTAKELKEEKEEAQKRGGFLSKLRKFLTGD